MQIKQDDLTGPEIARLLQEHLDNMHQISPRESVHALDINALRQPAITFWSVWDGEQLAGCGALKELNSQHGEIKSMRTAESYRGQGVASLLLEHILKEAKTRKYQRISLETGSQTFFEPARRLYARFGFNPCGPFEGYTADPNSYFMSLEIN